MSKSKQITLSYDNPASERLIAVENAIMCINDAMDELRGFGEFEDWFNALDDLYDELEAEQDKLESYATGEYQAEMDELRREYERDLLW